MRTQLKKSTFKSWLNRSFRRSQRNEVAKLDTGIVTLRSVYKNKQLITVLGDNENRAYQRL